MNSTTINDPHMANGQALLFLKKRLLEILLSIPPHSKVVLVDYPLHGNIGDLLIHLGEERFFADNDIHVTHRFTYHDYHRPASLTHDHIFVFHGGGNFGDLYPEHRIFLERIVTENPHHRIVVLPQTVHFRDKATFEITCQLLKSHPSLTFYARDNLSYEILISGGLSSVKLMPDMAHQLAGEMGDLHDSTSPRPNYILRRDMETNGAGTLLGEQAGVSLDWVDAMSLANKTLVALFYRMAKAYGPKFLRSPIIHAWSKLRDSVIEDGKRMILKAPFTYTDRLHVMILSLLVERPVHVFDNSYGKVRNYYETWLQGNPLIVCETFWRG